MAWPALIRHVAGIERAQLRATFKSVCDAREAGRKFIHRACDLPAGSSSPMKWVNPPVAWMLHAGAPLLLDANVHIPGMHDGDSTRIALEAYPGPERRAARLTLLQALEAGSYSLQIRLDTSDFGDQLLADGSGDLIDAVLCALLAGWAWQRREQQFGLPPHDGLEGWIVGA